MKEVYFLALQFSCKKRESIFRATKCHDMILIHQSSSIVLFVIYYRAAILREEQCHRSQWRNLFNLTIIGHKTERQSTNQCNKQQK